MFLDELQPLKESAQFAVDKKGLMGIDDQYILHNGKYIDHGIGAHAPSVIEYELDGNYNTFECEVAINDIPAMEQCNSVDFYVYADDVLVNYVPMVYAHEPSRTVCANIYGAKKLVLKAMVRDGCPNNWCQSVWINPRILTEFQHKRIAVLGDIVIELPLQLEFVDKCIVVVSDNTFIDKLDTMLCSLFLNGQCQDTKVVLFAFGDISAFEYLISKYQVLLVKCEYQNEFTYKIKTAALCAPYIINANKYVYLDSDMLVLQNIQSLFDNIDLYDDKIMMCRESSVPVRMNLGETVSLVDSIYRGYGDDAGFLRLADHVVHYKTIVNNGVYAGSRKSILGIGNMIESLAPNSIIWEKMAIDRQCFWREQAIMNIACAKLNNIIEISRLYNTQLHFYDVDVEYPYQKKPIVRLDNQKVCVMHFNGSARDKYSDVWDYYSNLAQTYSITRDTLYYRLMNSISRWYNESIEYQRIIDKKILDRYINFIYHIIKNNAYNNILIVDNKYALYTHVLNYICKNIKVTSMTEQYDNLLENYFGKLGVNVIEGDLLVNLQQAKESINYDLVICCSSKSIYELNSALVSLDANDYLMLNCYDFDVNQLIKKLRDQEFKILPINIMNDDKVDIIMAKK